MILKIHFLFIYCLEYIYKENLPLFSGRTSPILFPLLCPVFLSIHFLKRINFPSFDGNVIWQSSCPFIQISTYYSILPAPPDLWPFWAWCHQCFSVLWFCGTNARIFNWFFSAGHLSLIVFLILPLFIFLSTVFHFQILWFGVLHVL